MHYLPILFIDQLSNRVKDLMVSELRDEPRTRPPGLRARRPPPAAALPPRSGETLLRDGGGPSSRKAARRAAAGGRRSLGPHVSGRGTAARLGLTAAGGSRG